MGLLVPQVAQAERRFVTVWEIGRIDRTLTIPTEWGNAQPYDFTIDWGDGIVEHVTGDDPDPTHTYAQAGTYTVQISGVFPRLVLANTGGGRQSRLRDILQWGDIRWSSMRRAFEGTSGLSEISATDAPDLVRVTDLSAMFRGSGFNGAINHWDVSNVQMMEAMFRETLVFNQPIGNWEVSRVTNMAEMFWSGLAFNQPIGEWDVSSVTTMERMFALAEAFNQPIGEWDVARVTDMQEMFSHTQMFNQPLGAWSTRSVKELGKMFEHAAAFNQPIENWDLSSATSLIEVFSHAPAFNQPLAGWNVAKVRNMRGLFQHATSFDQPLADWDVSQVYNFASMFEGAHAFDQDLSLWQVAEPGNRNFSNFLYGTTLSTVHYDALLVGWAQQDLELFQTFHAGNATYSEAGRSARVYIRDHFGWVIQDGGTAGLYTAEAFVTTWAVQHPQTTITIPTNGEGVSPYDFTIDWGDGTVEHITGEDPDPTHLFAAPGAYTIYITGIFPRLAMAELFFAVRPYLTHVRQWGSIAWERMDAAFEGCEDLQVIAQDVPDLSRVTSMQGMFKGSVNLNICYDISQWDVSRVTDMSFLFSGATLFNQLINGWDVSRVTTFNYMFSGATSFNQPLDQWDMRAARTLNGMFKGSRAFDQDLSGWDVSGVTHIAALFNYASSFNQPLGAWDMSSVSDMTKMFEGAWTFNQPLEGWDVSNVTTMEDMFAWTGSFNQPLEAWDVSQVTNMVGMFRGTEAFNQPLQGWDVSQVQSMKRMFAQTAVFNQPLEAWDVSSVTTMEDMFERAEAFDQAVAAWDVSSVVTMEDMFSRTEAFNQPLAGWDVSSVVNGRYMFEYSKAFNQPIGDLVFAEGGDIAEMFRWAEAFDQCLGDLDIEHVSVRSMLAYMKISTSNYDCTLNGWAQQQLPRNMNWNGGDSKYSAAGAAARQYIIDTFNWNMLDGGLDPAALIDAEVLPDVLTFALETPYPNPALQTTTIPYTLPAEATTFTLTAYDLLGRAVTTIRQGTATPGRYEAILPTATLPSGTYFVRLMAGRHTHTQTLVVAR
ncbi:MAG: hypothetical protein RhofKO_02480 [Rhodothermales bacterium]